MQTLRRTLLALALATVQAKVYFKETFDKDIPKRWTPSEWKDADSTGKWVHTAGEWFVDEALAKGMQASEDMKFHSISAPLDSKASTEKGTLVLQYTVKHEKKDYAFCGGGYIKLLPGKVDGKTFGGDTPYSIMFGPDLCGYDISRVHLIFEHGGENLLKEEEIKLDYADKDEFTHLYTLVLEKDGSYEVFFDQVSKASGNIVDGWAFPDKEIKDPDQSKPEDWVDTKKIPDPESAKPEGYDDIPAEIPDPEAETPEDWDEEEDGEWEPPMIDNPEYKGEWKAPMIENPDYKGAWVHPMIPNKAYAPETYAKYKDLTTVGFELWTVNGGSIFDNILVTDDKATADKMAEETWAKIKEGEKEKKEEWKKENEPEPEEPEDEDDAEDAEDEEDAKDEL
jgi:calreticulin